MPFLKDKAPVREGAQPRLKAIKGVNAEGESARYVGEAMDNVQGGAGRAELDWVLANPKEARKMLKGDNLFFFPSAAVGDGDDVPLVVWGSDRFYMNRRPRNFGWNDDNNRVVQVG